jgi:hypothetical protein
VLLVNLGTPDSPSVPDVRRYLAEFLADPWVIRLPRAMRWFNPVLSRIIALARGKRSAHAYQSIWTDEGSPLAVITRRQAEGLGKRLPRGWQVFYAMRYGNPSLRQVLAEIERERITDLVVVPMYPQWSGPTTGTALESFYAELQRLGAGHRGLRITCRCAPSGMTTPVTSTRPRARSTAPPRNTASRPRTRCSCSAHTPCRSRTSTAATRTRATCAARWSSCASASVADRAHAHRFPEQARPGAVARPGDR